MRGSSNLRAIASSRGAGGIKWAALARILSSALLLVTGAMVSRLVSTAAFGAYFLEISVTSGLALAVALGLNQTVVADVARATALGDLHEARRAFIGASIPVLVSACLIGSLLSLSPIQAIISTLLATKLLLTAGSGLGLMLIATVAQTQVAQLLRGLKRFRAAELTGGLIANALVASSFAAMLWVGHKPQLMQLLIVTAVGYLAPALVGMALIAAHLGGWGPILRAGRSGHGQPILRLKESWPAAVHSIALFTVRQSDLWIVAVTTGPMTTGLYAAASKIAATLSYPLSIMNSVAAPYVASMYESRRAKAQTVLTLSATAAAFPTLAAAVFLITFSGTIFGHLMGEPYRAASTIAVVLALGQIVNVLGGSCGITLLMTRQQRPLAVISTTTAILSVTAGYLLGKTFGGVGVAAGFAAGLALQNVWMCWLTYRRTGLRTEFRLFTSWRLLRSIWHDGLRLT